jgi:hypothetical protein
MTFTDWTNVFPFPLFVAIVFLVPQVLLYWKWMAAFTVVFGLIVLFFYKEPEKDTQQCS